MKTGYRISWVVAGAVSAMLSACGTELGNTFAQAAGSEADYGLRSARITAEGTSCANACIDQYEGCNSTGMFDGRHVGAATDTCTTATIDCATACPGAVRVDGTYHAANPTGALRAACAKGLGTSEKAYCVGATEHNPLEPVNVP